MSSLESCLGGANPATRSLLERCLEGHEPSWEEALPLAEARGVDLHALVLVADRLRSEQAGEPVTYVVNRNVNFTNACVKACRFCAFARGHRSEEAYFLGEDEIIRRALEARSLGATEICVQAGLAPGVDGRFYVELTRALKRAAPELDLHAFSPEEIKYGAGLARVPVRAYLEELKDAGLGSLPGTSAEILDDTVRAKIAPGRISTAEWIDVIRTAHSIGLPTTATIMYGHIETDAERLRHIELLRGIQRETAGFTEFVPLSFVHEEAPMFRRGLVGGLRPGPTGNDVVRLFAISRLMLGRSFRNLQVSWVKEGLRQASVLLGCGANDLGGTLMNESISTAAGAAHGQLATPSSLRRIARDAGRLPAQRDTRYRVLRTFAEEPGEDALDRITDPDAILGSYAALTRDTRFRFRKEPKPKRSLV